MISSLQGFASLCMWLQSSKLEACVRASATSLGFQHRAHLQDSSGSAWGEIGHCTFEAWSCTGRTLLFGHIGCFLIWICLVEPLEDLLRTNLSFLRLATDVAIPTGRSADKKQLRMLYLIEEICNCLWRALTIQYWDCGRKNLEQLLEIGVWTSN